MNSTIVTLGSSPGVKGSTTVSAFEEAFGEYSEARGRGRARRKKRRLERIANRKEVRSARRSARQEERMERQVGRQQVKQAKKQARIAKRAAAQADRQAKRTSAMQARQERRFQRKEMRLQRKALGDTPEVEMDDQTMIESGVGQPTMQQDEGYTSSEQGGGYVDAGPQGQDSGYAETEQSGGYSEDSGYTEDSGYSEPQSQGGAMSSGEEQVWDNEGTPDEGDSGEYVEEGESYSEEDYGDSGFDGEDSDFDGGDDTDGIIALEDEYNEFNDERSVRVKPAVGEVAKKIEWNKELISRLEDKANSNPAMKKDINSKIQSRLKRIAELEQQLSKYQNFEGDFSSADGEFVEYSDARGRKKVSPQQKRGRVREVIKAKRKAISERKSVQGDAGLKKGLLKKFSPKVAAQKLQQIRAKRRMSDGGDVTPVDRDLNPEIEEQRIEIPAEETSYEATGLNGLDLKRDFDAPRARYVELSSNADGDKKKKINWTGIAIGVGVAVVAIWAIRKYKVFGK